MISKCWSGNPKERYSFDTIFSILSSDRTILDDEFDDDKVDNYLYELKTVSFEKKKNDEFESMNEYLRLLISAIENRNLNKIDYDSLTD